MKVWEQPLDIRSSGCFDKLARGTDHHDQGRIQDFFKKEIVSMRVQGKRPGAKKWGRGSWRVMFE